MKALRAARRCTAWLCATLVLTASPLSYADVTQADNAALEALIERGVPIVDIRTATEWRTTGVVEDSHLMTFFDEQGRYDVQAWMEKLTGIARPEQPVAIICLTGARSTMLTHFLDTQAGYRQVINVTGGIDAWIKAGRATVPTGGTATTD